MKKTFKEDILSILIKDIVFACIIGATFFLLTFYIYSLYLDDEMSQVGQGTLSDDNIRYIEEWYSKPGKMYYKKNP